MYKLLQTAALMVLVIIGTLACSQFSADSNHTLAIHGIGLFLMVILAGDALRTLWRS